jgi:hypothetical protein
MDKFFKTFLQNNTRYVAFSNPKLSFTITYIHTHTHTVLDLPQLSWNSA